MVLTGWGRTAPTAAWVTRLAAERVPEAVRRSGPRGVIARGLGRSYGDAAQNSGGDVLLLGDVNTPAVLDRDAATVRVSAGASLDSLMRQILPHGFFVPVTPGTRFVTVGGAVAADVHGKNHHVEGSFGQHVVELDLLDASGEMRTISPDSDPELFWATVGGMGLTGVLLSATVRLKRVESAYMLVETSRAASLTELVSTMRQSDDQFTYSVAWIDLLSHGRRLGRSVLTRGEHAPWSTLTDYRRGRSSPLDLGRGPRLSAPPWVPSGLVNKWSVAAFNEMWFRKAPQHRVGELQHLTEFFHPLDGVARWNRLYGPRGLLQYQFVIPEEAEDALGEAVKRIVASGHASFLAVLKRFGPGNAGVLSFPMAGWTLALDLPASSDLGRLLHDLDDIVVSARGRVYLAKDARTPPDTLERMYPRLEEFRALRRKIDPSGVFVSDLARRLRL